MACWRFGPSRREKERHEDKHSEGVWRCVFSWSVACSVLSWNWHGQIMRFIYFLKMLVGVGALGVFLFSSISFFSTFVLSTCERQELNDTKASCAQRLFS